MKIGQKQTSYRKKEGITALLFAVPIVLKAVIFTLCCIAFGLYYSFTDYNIFNDSLNFIRFENYATLFGDIQFLKAVFNTFYLMLSIPIVMVLGFLLAYVLNKKIYGNMAFRVIYYLPAVSSALAIGIVWKWILNDEYGLLNTLLGTNIGWLTDDNVVKNSLIIKAVWGGLGSSMLMQLAGMQNIGQEYYEAADLDGAGEFTKMVKITLPMMTPILFYLLTVNVIGGLNSFSDNYIIVSTDATKTVVYYIYLKITSFGKYGLASAASVLLGVFVFAISFVQFRFSRKWVLEN